MLIAPRDTTGPWKRWLNSWQLSFNSVADSAYALYTCFHHVWYAFTSASNEVWGKDEKMFRACYCSPSIHWRFKFYATLICVLFR